MEIKPIRPIAKVDPAEIPQTKIDRNQPRTPAPIKVPEGKWQFRQGRIILDGQDVGTLLSEAGPQPPAFWSKLAGDLAAYRAYALRKHSPRTKKKIDDEEELDPESELGQISALVEAYIAKIMRILKRKYDETADGQSCSLDEEGQLCLNGMNVTAFIEMARNYPNEKASVFLRGLKTRLGVILSNKSRNANYEKIHDVITTLFHEIDNELKRIIEKDRLIEN